MFLSIFDVFKIGIGPSSSHTMGPMTAAARFLDALRSEEPIPGAGPAVRLGCRLHGSLAHTGRGHATDRAVMLGLAGFRPDVFDAEKAAAAEAALRETKVLDLKGLGTLAFDPEADLVFDYGPALEAHTNGLVLSAFDAEGNLRLRETYYSVGGGFVLTEAEMAERDRPRSPEGPDVPFPFENAAQMLDMARSAGLSIAELKRANEETRMKGRALDESIDRIWAVMDACIERGVGTGGVLPGGLNVRRRAKRIADSLAEERGRNQQQPHVANDWLSLYAMAVNEENAAGGQVVTAPTNGAAGVFPSVVRYYRDHVVGATHNGLRDMFLTGAAVGGLIKHNASISGAECGCQAEVGSASAMAAAGLCAAMGGSPEQVENAAEIALEHHLGMTCDPVAGLVQVPCIERNGLGAIK
ncbi:MAG: L-serine ammonia-lyase [Pseudomonadota bacterium]